MIRQILLVSLVRCLVVLPEGAGQRGRAAHVLFQPANEIFNKSSLIMPATK